MKKITYILILTLFDFSCKKADDAPKPQPIRQTQTTQKIPSKSEYWGCWKEINTTANIYDIILTEYKSTPHGFQFSNNCAPIGIPEQKLGVFRNDTLVFDNSIFEYWCYVENDTLSYGVYTPTPPQPVKFTK